MTYSLGIPPIILCQSLSILIGSGLVIATAVIYIKDAIDAKRFEFEMIHSHQNSKKIFITVSRAGGGEPKMTDAEVAQPPDETKDDEQYN